MTANQKIVKMPARRVAPFYPPATDGTEASWTVDVYAATHEPARWRSFNRAAARAYAQRALQAVGEEQHIDVDRYPTYFAEATVSETLGHRRAVGGIRIHASDEDGELLLFEELTGHIDVDALRRQMAFLRPQGLCHGGGLWIDPEYGRSGLAADLARACVPVIAALRATWCVAMTHTLILDAWASLGWHAVEAIDSFPYPDDRYQSSVILGGPKTWPAPVAAWAARQAGNATLDGPGARLAIESLCGSKPPAAVGERSTFAPAR